MQVEVILKRKGRTVHVVPPIVTLLDALSRMTQARVSALVVSEDDRHVAGILSDRDVIRQLGHVGPDALGRSVAETMTADVITCRPTDRILHVMNIMTQERIRHVPVVDGEDDHLVGLVSIGDMVKNRLDEIEMEAESLRDYITRTH